MDDKLLLDEVSQKSESTIGQESSSSPEAVTERFSPRKWGLVLLSAILLLSGFSVSVSRLLSANSDASRHTETPILSAKITHVKEVKSYSVKRTYTGEVVATRTSELGFERSGKIVWLNVDRGDWVEAGEAIAKLDTQNLEAQQQQLLAQKVRALAVLQELQNGPRFEAIVAARAQVRDLKNQLELEERRRTRREYLYQEGAISKEQLDEVAFNKDALSARLAAAQSRLDELQAGTRPEQIAAQQAVVKQLEASITDIKITIAKSTITTPFSGTIGERRLDEGTVISAGQSVVRLVEGASPEVEIGIPTDVASQLELRSNKQVEIGQKTYRATVASIKPEVNPTTRTRTVVLRLDASALRSVAPKQIARLEITQTVSTEGYWLPMTALVRGERGLWSCYALVEAQKNSDSRQDKPYRVERRDLEVLHTESDRVLVRGTLQPGDIVMVNGTQRIVPGQLVRAVDS